MVIDAKNLIQRSDIRTMRKDIQQLRKNGAIKEIKEIVATKVVEQKTSTQLNKIPSPQAKENNYKQALSKIEEPKVTIEQTKKVTQQNQGQENNQPIKAKFSSLVMENNIQKQPIITEAPKVREYLKEIPEITPVVREKLAESGKIEEKQRKKFMEDIEEWVKKEKENNN